MKILARAVPVHLSPAILARFAPAIPVRFALALPVLLSLASCATLREFTALNRVDFSLMGVSEGTLAGIPIDSTRSLDELSALSVARLGIAISQGELPLEAVIDVRAANPSGNATARLLSLDWTLFLDDRETVSGFMDEEYVLAPGDPVIVPVRVELDLLEFFDGQLERMVDLALAVAGAGEPQQVQLEATPTVQTPLGPLSYPEPIRIEYEVGG